MDRRRIPPGRHGPAHRLNLPKEMAFPDAAKGRIARQGTYVGLAHRDKGGPRPDPVRCEGGFHSRVSAPDHHDVVVMFHVKRSYLPMQKDEKISDSTVSVPIRPINSSSEAAAAWQEWARSSGSSGTICSAFAAASRHAA